MGPDETRRYGFGMSREAHIAFVTIYLTILLLVAGFGVLRFAAALPFWAPLWKRPAAVAMRDHPYPISDPVRLGSHQATYPPIAVKLHQEGDVLLRLTVLPDGTVGTPKSSHRAARRSSMPRRSSRWDIGGIGRPGAPESRSRPM
jgi:hypothetical protein